MNPRIAPLFGHSKLVPLLGFVSGGGAAARVPAEIHPAPWHDGKNDHKS